MIHILYETIDPQKYQASDHNIRQKFHHRYNNNKKVRTIVLEPEIYPCSESFIASFLKGGKNTQIHQEK